MVREIAGHLKTRTTLDIYSQVGVDEPTWRRDGLWAAARAMPRYGSEEAEVGVEEPAEPAPQPLGVGPVLGPQREWEAESADLRALSDL